MRRAIYAALTGLLIAGCSSGGLAGGGAADAGKEYTFAINVKPNQAFSYQMNMATEGGQSMKIAMAMTMTAEKVENDQTTFRTKITSMTMNGQPLPGASATAMNAMSVVQVMDKHGKTLSTHVEGVPGAAQPQAGAVTTAAFPDHPVKVGDTWSAEAQGIKVNYKFSSVENKNGKNIAVFDATPDEAGKAKISGTVKVEVDTDTGMPISAVINGIVSPGGKMDMTMTQTN